MRDRKTESAILSANGRALILLLIASCRFALTIGDVQAAFLLANGGKAKETPLRDHAEIVCQGREATSWEANAERRPALRCFLRGSASETVLNVATWHRTVRFGLRRRGTLIRGRRGTLKARGDQSDLDVVAAHGKKVGCGLVAPGDDAWEVQSQGIRKLLR